MTQYSEVAVKVVERILYEDPQLDPAEEWENIANQIIIAQSSKEKGCPKDAFLGLCSA